ncbi:MAG: CBS domain-containing protein [Actinomycetota bacterium]
MIWPNGPRVVYSRGKGCSELAELLSPAAVRVTGDLGAACAEARADLLVARRPPGGFQLVSVVSPIDFESEGVGTVVAAVAGGPHSALNVAVADLLARHLQVSLVVATAYVGQEAKTDAEELVEQYAAPIPASAKMAVESSDAAQFVAALPERSLLVLGEPGGSILSRLFFGPGARLRARAQAGTVMVRSAPDRVFQLMTEPVFVGPLHQAGDTLRLHGESLMAVVENGHLVGVVRRQVLERARREMPVAELMEEPIAVAWDASLEQAADLRRRTAVAPLPVTDQDGRLVGAWG